MPTSEVMGLNGPTMAPGFGFVFGEQPTYLWMDSIANAGQLSTATSMNQLFIQTYNETLDLRANFEPLKDFRLDINVNKNYSQNASELYKNTSTLEDPVFEHLNQVDMGTFSISYSIFGTVFEKLDPKKVSATFKQDGLKQIRCIQMKNFLTRTMMYCCQTMQKVTDHIHRMC